MAGWTPRVIEDAGERELAPVEPDEAAGRAMEAEMLVVEARIVERRHGKNALSDYLRKHRRRPPPETAAGIGRLYGWRVKADDGKWYPPFTKRQKQLRREARERRKLERRFWGQVGALKTALACLAEMKDSPADVLEWVHSRLDAPLIRDNLPAAIEWLQRFAQEWGDGGHGQARRTPPQDGCPDSGDG